jgi:hypothetical protein
MRTNELCEQYPNLKPFPKGVGGAKARTDHIHCILGQLSYSASPALCRRADSRLLVEDEDRGLLTGTNNVSWH